MAPILKFELVKKVVHDRELKEHNLKFIMQNNYTTISITMTIKAMYQEANCGMHHLPWLAFFVLSSTGTPSPSSTMVLIELTTLS
jgi:hypothetical protein